MRDQPGRPTKSDGPAFPHDETDNLLVHGEVVETESDDGTRVRYPSYRELAERFGVAHSLIAKFSKEHNCLARRRQADKRVKEMADTKLIELRADSLALTRDDAVRVIDRYLAQFEGALQEGRVRCDNPSDFNLMVRLKSFVMGDADSRHEMLGGITLEDIQQRHAQLLKTWEEATPEMCGLAMPPLPASMAADGDDGEDNDDAGDAGDEGGGDEGDDGDEGDGSGGGSTPPVQ